MSNLGNKKIMSKNILHYMAMNNIDRKQLASALDVAYTTLTDWINAKTYPRIDRIEEMAEYFNVSKADLVEDPHSFYNDAANKNLPPHNKKPAVRIPVLGSVPAGIPIEAVEDILDWEEIPESMTHGGREYFGLVVSGDSMSPTYLKNDVLIVRKQSTCDNGQDCIVMVNGDDSTFKRVQLLEGGSIMLRPLNPTYEIKTFSKKEIHDLPISILGTVVEVRRKILY